MDASGNIENAEIRGGDCSMDACPDKVTMLDLISHGCLVKPSTARADAQASERPGSAILYHDQHLIIDPADPDAANKFDLSALSSWLPADR